MRIFVLLFAALSIAGCEERQVVAAGCGDVEVDDGALQSVIVHGDVDAGVDAPLSEEPKGAGAVCVTDEDCASKLCLPSNTKFFEVSYCFSRDAEGCMTVSPPPVDAEPCTKPGGKVYACGDTWDVALFGECDEVYVGAIGETYHCCAPKQFP
jgi:hypothetical protein